MKSKDSKKSERDGQRVYSLHIDEVLISYKLAASNVEDLWKWSITVSAQHP